MFGNEKNPLFIAVDSLNTVRKKTNVINYGSEIFGKDLRKNVCLTRWIKYSEKL